MTMKRTIRGLATVKLAALLVLVIACDDDFDAQARAAERAVVLAHAEAPREAVVTPTDSPAVAPTPRYENVTYGEAEAEFRKGRYEESAAMFDAFTAARPDHAFGHYMLGLSAWKSGDHARAEEALGRAAELAGTSVKIRTNLGRVLLERGRALDALPHLETAVDLEPTAHEVWRVLGNAYAQLQRGDDAIAAYREALMLNEYDSWTMNNYGLLLIQLGRYDEALRPLARAVELVPLSATFQNNLGVALERVGEIEGARQAFAAALAADSSHARARTSLERVESRLLDTTMDAPDLSVFALEFTDMIRSWSAEEEHDC